MLRRDKQWLLANLRAAIEYVVVPGVLALLPFRLGVSIAWQVARWQYLYRQLTEPAVKMAKHYGWCLSEKAFARRYRFHRLMDAFDLYLSKTRSDRHLAKHIDVKGEWPSTNKPVLIVGFHWGGGLFAVKALLQAGFRLGGPANEVTPSQSGFVGVLYRYAKARNNEVIRIIDEVIIMNVAENPYKQLKGLAERGVSVIGLIDVPPSEIGGGKEVPFLDRRADLPAGLIKLARLCSLPVVFFTMRVNPTTRRRELSISNYGPVSSVQHALEHGAGMLDAAVREDPAAWHLWPQAPAFFKENSGQ